MKFVFMVGDDVSQEELEAAVEESVKAKIAKASQRKSGKNKATSDSSSKGQDTNISPLLKPTQIRNGVIRNIRKKDSSNNEVGEGETSSKKGVRKSQRRYSCSEDLKDKLRGSNDVIDNDIIGALEQEHNSDWDDHDGPLPKKRKYCDAKDLKQIESKHSEQEQDVQNSLHSKNRNSCVSNISNSEPLNKRPKLESPSASVSISKKGKQKDLNKSLPSKDSQLQTNLNGANKLLKGDICDSNGEKEAATIAVGSQIPVIVTWRTNKLQHPNHSEQNGPVATANGDAFSLSNISPSALSAPKPREIKDDSFFIKLSQSIPDELYVALDCEFLGIGPKGSTSVLGRCSIINYNGHVIYDKFVCPREVITDFRTRWSGIRPSDMAKALPVDDAMREINNCLANKIVVGHAVYNDFKVLGMQRQPHTVRDTTACRHLTERAGFARQCNGLKKLSEAVLGRKIQVGKKGHCSVEDALASLDLFKVVRSQWEPELMRAWDKKGVDVKKAIAEMRGARPEDFLEDKFWPSDMTGNIEY